MENNLIEKEYLNDLQTYVDQFDFSSVFKWIKSVWFNEKE